MGVSLQRLGVETLGSGPLRRHLCTGPLHLSVLPLAWVENNTLTGGTEGVLLRLLSLPRNRGSRVGPIPSEERRRVPPVTYTLHGPAPMSVVGPVELRKRRPKVGGTEMGVDHPSNRVLDEPADEGLPSVALLGRL